MNTKDKLLELAAIASRTEPSKAERELVGEAVRENLYARFFYYKAANHAWVEAAVREIMQDGGIEEAIWVRLQYLLRVLAERPADLGVVLTQVRDRLNGRMLYDVVHALLAQEPEFAWAQRGLVYDYVGQPTHIIASELGSYLVHAAKAKDIEIADLCRLVAVIVSFVPDPKQAEKEADREKNTGGYFSRLDPVPRFDEWEYEQILEKGVRPLAKRFPVPISVTLVEVVRQFVRLKEPNPDRRYGVLRDNSEFWCARLDERDGMNPAPDQSVVHTLCFACETAYASEGRRTGSLDALDQTMRAEPWRIFERVRYHLYAKFPQTAALWITEAVIGHTGYSVETYGQEFAQMVRQGAITFGEALLPPAARAKIFAEIKAGPVKEAFEARGGAEGEANEFAAHCRRFWARQLWPFEPLLTGEYAMLYRESSAIGEPISAANYTRFSSSSIHAVESRSPKPLEELAAMSDDALIVFLNEWNEGARDAKSWWIETNFEGLAHAFRKLVRQNPARFAAFGPKWEAVKRPIFLRFVVDAAKEEVKDGKPAHIAAWIRLCDWIVRHEDPREVDRKELDESSAVKPSWESTRREVVDFVGMCVAEQSKVPAEWREPLVGLLAALGTGYDLWLDRGEPVTTPSDPLTEAINTTRGRALETMVQLGVWTHRLGGDAALDPLRGVKPVFERRFEGKPPLVLAEFAQFGRLYPFLLNLDDDWSAAKAEQIFADLGSPAWQSSFGTFVMFTEPSKELHRLLRPHYAHAVGHAELWADEGRSRRDFLPRLGQHLFLYYVWGLESLEGADSLFAAYFRVTKPAIWAGLLQYVGQSLKRTDKLEPDLQERCMRYFNSRLAVGNATELVGYTFWLEAECLNIKWRLNNLAAALELPDQPDRVSMMVLSSLIKLLPREPDLVVVAFAKLVSRGVSSHAFYLDRQEATSILEAGFASGAPTTREAAQAAQESLLRSGRFEFLEVGG